MGSQFQGFIKETGIQDGSYYDSDRDLIREWWTGSSRIRDLSDTELMKSRVQNNLEL